MAEDSRRKFQEDALKYSSEQFDKNVLYIASGAFAVSFAFIKDIVPNLSSAECIKILMLSWYAFALAIFSSLVSHYLSVQTYKRSLSVSHLSRQKQIKKMKPWKVAMIVINISMIALILLGSVLLIYFVQRNLS